ncbi:unnamed protein product [Caenorhabditis angaria]|uniref:F-box domain-containing protein n=1 Tax=Caenorhabditis angaria TaxID=860376 RepID=A0A9P1IF73_9PELO|nr:unnamed protein product [Caenorhabditis angaria]
MVRLPLEMREIVIDYMAPETRCRFAQCSKLCEIEVKMCGKYVRSIEIGREIHPELKIGHSSSGFEYALEFIDIFNLTERQSMVVYKTTDFNEDYRESNKKVKWIETKYESAEEVRSKYLKDFLENYHKSIQNLILGDTEFAFDEWNVKMLKNLYNIEDFTFKDLIRTGFMEFPQILKADWCKIEGTSLTFDEIIQYKGVVLIAKSSQFNESNVARYLRMLRDGTLPKQKGFIIVTSSNTSRRVNFKELSEGLELLDYTETDCQCVAEFCIRWRSRNNRDCFAEVCFSHGSFNLEIGPV